MKNIIYLILLCSITSCATFSKSDFRKEYCQLENNSLNKLNGTYSLYPTKRYKKRYNKNAINSINYADLYTEITGKPWKETNELSKEHYLKNNYFVSINFDNKSTLSIKLFENETMLKKEIIKGKIRNGMFYLDNKRSICRGIPYVFGGCSTDKRRLGISQTGQLIVNEALDNTGAILLIFAAGYSYNSSYEYAKVE